jgi:hypothetical protein
VSARGHQVGLSLVGAPAPLELVPERRWTFPEHVGPEQLYRFVFGWTWAPGPVGLFVGLNPSVATATENDLTVMKWRGFAARWGWGGYVAVNAFALRSTDPRGLVKSSHAGFAIGHRNDEHILEAAASSHEIVACWGAPPYRELIPRLAKVHLLLEQTGKPLFCLGTTSDGYPRHPSRIAYDTKRETFR